MIDPWKTAHSKLSIERTCFHQRFDHATDLLLGQEAVVIAHACRRQDLKNADANWHVSLLLRYCASTQPPAVYTPVANEPGLQGLSSHLRCCRTCGTQFVSSFLSLLWATEHCTCPQTHRSSGHRKCWKWDLPTIEHRIWVLGNWTL